MKLIIKDNQTQSEFRQFVISSYSDLMLMKKEGDKTAFNELMLKVLPQVQIYIAQKLNSAIKNNTIPKGKYKPDDFVDQLFIETYDYMDRIQNKKEFHLWLFKKADELLEDTIIDEEFDDFFFKNIDDYSKPEWDAMEENFSTDGDGDFVMIEELDDISYNKNDYTLKDVFIENEEQHLLEELDKNIANEKINTHIKMVLRQLPLQMQTVFDLVVYHQFEPSDVAKIKNISTQEVTELLNYTRNAIKVSFQRRFL